MHQPEHTPRTLFVDDESINQQIGAEILLARGAEADTVDNGLQALRRIRTRHYAIVFTYVEMPVMDGATLTPVSYTHLPDTRAVTGPRCDGLSGDNIVAGRSLSSLLCPAGAAPWGRPRVFHGQIRSFHSTGNSIS